MEGQHARYVATCRYIHIFSVVLTESAADRYLWGWHENYFDEDNCNFESLYLKDAFDALKLNAYCEEEGGHNAGWALGHYSEDKVVGDPGNDFAPLMPVVDQTYVVSGKTYRVRVSYLALCSELT
jgi:hypothetical protein